MHIQGGQKSNPHILYIGYNIVKYFKILSLSHFSRKFARRRTALNTTRRTVAAGAQLVQLCYFQTLQHVIQCKCVPASRLFIVSVHQRC